MKWLARKSTSDLLDRLVRECKEIDTRNLEDDERRTIDAWLRMRREFGYAIASQDDPRR